MHSPASLVLASNSPRRKDILRILGYPFEVVKPLTPEVFHSTDVSLPEITERLALAKARQVAASFADSVIIAADTLVSIDNDVLGKPLNEAEARKMLWKLRGRTHTVVTGVALLSTSKDLTQNWSLTSLVSMRPYSQDEVERYLATGAYADKAGAYGIQDASFSPADSVAGCYLNVVGLPLCTLAENLPKHGVNSKPAWKGIEPGNCSACKMWQEGVRE